VVDDEPAIRALVTKIVERAGFAVDSARDGAEAIEMMDQESYAVLVIDLMMPFVSGFELVEHIKARSGPQPAVIVITAASESATALRLDPHVVHSIVRKPFDIDVLGDLITATVRTIVETRKQEAADGHRVVPFHKREDKAC